MSIEIFIWTVVGIPCIFFAGVWLYQVINGIR
jgi:hypothetical protein